MGNVASAILMYALEAAWVFQRLIDQDYRQNHGSRVKPLTSLKVDDESAEFLPNGSSTPILSRSPHHHSRPARHHHHHPRGHKKTYSEPIAMSLPKLPRSRMRKRSASFRARRRRTPSTPVEPPSVPPCATDTTEWVSRLAESCSLDHPKSLRRAYSDINIAHHRRVPTPQPADLSDDSSLSPEESALRLVVCRRRSPDSHQDFRIYSLV